MRSPLGFFVLTAVLLSRLREKQDRLVASLDTDLMTGAVSARGFYRYANQELARARRYGRTLTLAYLDLAPATACCAWWRNPP